MKKKHKKKCMYCGKLKLLCEFYISKSWKDGRRGECKSCIKKNNYDLWEFGYQVWNKKRLLPRIKTLATIKQEVKTEKYMDSTIDRMAGLIADAIIRRKYGISNADIRRLEKGK